jgi:hypothetical protein
MNSPKNKNRISINSLSSNNNIPDDLSTNSRVS